MLAPCHLVRTCHLAFVTDTVLNYYNSIFCSHGMESRNRLPPSLQG